MANSDRSHRSRSQVAICRAAPYVNPASKKRSCRSHSFAHVPPQSIGTTSRALSKWPDCANLMRCAKKSACWACPRPQTATPTGAEAKASGTKKQTTGTVMVSLIVFSIRIIGGVLVLAVIWFVFDTIHDRNTEIIVAWVGLLYAFIFMISRRLQYFGLTIFSFFGRTSSYIKHVPYDQILRDEVGIHHSAGRHLYL